MVNAHDPTDVVIEESASINAQSTIALLKKLEQKNKSLQHIFVVADNARHYRNRTVKAFLKTSKVQIIFLPPHSPNLNLIERLWRFLKKLSYTIGTMSGLLISRKRFSKLFYEYQTVSLRAKVSHDPKLSHTRHVGVCCLLRRNLAPPRLRSPSYSHPFFQK